MKHSRYVLPGLVALTVLLSGCASTRLAGYSFAGAPMSVDARVSPDARVGASYSVVIDPNDPFRTALSIGSSMAKASQVAEAERKLAAALGMTDIRAVVEDELGRFVETTLGVRVVEERQRADFRLLITVEKYGLDAGGPGSAIEFEMTAEAMLFDVHDRGRIWRTRESVSRPASPAMFGLPAVAGTVLSAVMLRWARRPRLS